MTFTVERKRHVPGAVPPSRVTKKAPARPMSRKEIADAVADFKHAARRLRPQLNQKPNAFHEDKDELVVATLDLDMIEEVRRTWQFFRDRRPDAYGPLVED